MDTPERKKEKSLAIGLVGLIIVIVILALIGFFMLEPNLVIIQGWEEDTEVSVSGKVQGLVT